jgi:putative ABC transport system substrate-binding protein
LQPIYDGLLQGMRELGYRQGSNFAVEWRLAEGQYERFTEFAAELVRQKVDVIVLGTPTAIRPTQQATSSDQSQDGRCARPDNSAATLHLRRRGDRVRRREFRSYGYVLTDDCLSDTLQAA